MSVSQEEIAKSIAIDPASPVPMHVQIKDALADLMDSGTLPPGARLPAVSLLASSCGVAPRTAWLAVAQLQREGRAVSHVGRGVFVRKPEDAATHCVVYVCMNTQVMSRHLDARFRTLQGIIRKAAEHDVELRPVTQASNFNRHLPLEGNAGILFMEAHCEKEGFGEISAYALAHNVPCCSANNRHPPHPGVEAQHEQAGLLATEHLLRLGHRRIALAKKAIYGPESLQERIEAGYVKALRRYGVLPDPSLVMELPESADDAPAALPGTLDRFLAQGARPTAFVFDCDENAMAMLDLLRERGLRVPEDVSVVGHENMPAASSSNPPLTTVDAKCPERGEKAMEYLLAKVAGEDPDEPEVFPELVVRESTGPCREGAPGKAGALA